MAAEALLFWKKKEKRKKKEEEVGLYGGDSRVGDINMPSAALRERHPRQNNGLAGYTVKWRTRGRPTTKTRDVYYSFASQHSLPVMLFVS